MPPSEQDVAAEFAEHYELAQPDVAGDVELAVLGVRWGANGYTTRRQADALARAAGLGPEKRVLDIGAGRGWPGLYLAATNGGEVVMVDLPLAALAVGAQRAEQEGLARCAGAVVGSARRLPFAPASFDAIVHTDVLCCVRPKLTVLRECLRLLLPGGRTAFHVIHVADGLAPAQRRRAARDGPPFVTTSRSYGALLAAAGFTEIGEVDGTEEFSTVTGAWIEQRGVRRAALVEALGESAFEERQANGRAKLLAIEDGLLRRSLFTARRPATTDARGVTTP